MTTSQALIFVLSAFLIVQLCLATPAVSSYSSKQKFWEDRGYKRDITSDSAPITPTTIANTPKGAMPLATVSSVIPIDTPLNTPVTPVTPPTTTTETNARATRSLGTLNPWQYGDFTVPDMTLNEQRVANAILTYISANRHGAGFIYDQSSRSFLNTMYPVVELSKYLADLLMIYRGNDTDYLAQVAIGHNFTCDLDWSQPDPASDYGTIFSANDDWCATAVDVLWASGADASDVQSQLDYYYIMSIGDHSLKQINVACSLEAPTTFHCVVILARLEQTLNEQCLLCCDPYACAKKR